MDISGGNTKKHRRGAASSRNIGYEFSRNTNSGILIDGSTFSTSM